MLTSHYIIFCDKKTCEDKHDLSSYPEYFFIYDSFKNVSWNIRQVTLLKIVIFYSHNYSLPVRRKKVTYKSSFITKTNVILHLSKNNKLSSGKITTLIKYLGNKVNFATWCDLPDVPIEVLDGYQYFMPRHQYDFQRLLIKQDYPLHQRTVKNVLRLDIAFAVHMVDAFRDTSSTHHVQGRDLDRIWRIFIMYRITNNQFSPTLMASPFFICYILYLRTFNHQKL